MQCIAHCHVTMPHLSGINTEEGGTLGFPPPDWHPSPLKIAKYYIIVECDKMIDNNFLFVYVVSDATRNSLRGRTFQNFLGAGACPQTPLVWVRCHVREFPPPRKNPVLIPVYVYVSIDQAFSPNQLAHCLSLS
jgi:hypothetical protein